MVSRLERKHLMVRRLDRNTFSGQQVRKEGIQWLVAVLRIRSYFCRIQIRIGGSGLEKSYPDPEKDWIYICLINFEQTKYNCLTLFNNPVTLRIRNTGQQVRIALSGVRRLDLKGFRGKQVRYEGIQGLLGQIGSIQMLAGQKGWQYLVRYINIYKG